MDLSDFFNKETGQLDAADMSKLLSAFYILQMEQEKKALQEDNMEELYMTMLVADDVMKSVLAMDLKNLIQV